MTRMSGSNGSGAAAAGEAGGGGGDERGRAEVGSLGRWA